VLILLYFAGFILGPLGVDHKGKKDSLRYAYYKADEFDAGISVSEPVGKWEATTENWKQGNAIGLGYHWHCDILAEQQNE
jgi:hypothetical protein